MHRHCDHDGRLASEQKKESVKSIQRQFDLISSNFRANARIHAKQSQRQLTRQFLVCRSSTAGILLRMSHSIDSYHSFICCLLVKREPNNITATHKKTQNSTRKR